MSKATEVNHGNMEFDLAVFYARQIRGRIATL